MPEAAAALFVPLWIMMFPAMWLGISWLIAKQGGWQELAEFYRIEKYPARPRKKSGLQTIYMKGCRYRNAVTIDFDEEGIYLYPMILFRFKHDLLYIPWEDITVHSKSAERAFFAFDFTRRLTFAKAPNVKVVFMKRLIPKFCPN